MKDINLVLVTQKTKIFEIITNFETYYQNNYLDWDIKEITASHQILGTLIMIFKKLESMQESIEYFIENDLLEMFELELKEVVIIVDYYHEIFRNKKGA